MSLSACLCKTTESPYAAKATIDKNGTDYFGAVLGMDYDKRLDVFNAVVMDAASNYDSQRAGTVEKHCAVFQVANLILKIRCEGSTCLGDEILQYMKQSKYIVVDYCKHLSSTKICTNILGSRTCHILIGLELKRSTVFMKMDIGTVGKYVILFRRRLRCFEET